MAFENLKSTNPVTAALRSTTGAWVHVGAFSAVVNILMLTGSLYMLQIYDRVLSSRSIATLIGISLLALAAYALQGWLDLIRLKMLGRIGSRVDAQLAPLVLRVALLSPLGGTTPTDALQPFRDLGAVRTFLSSLGPTAIIDLPFTPLFLFVCFMLHPWLGWFAISGLGVIVLLTLVTERRAEAPTRALLQSGARQWTMLESGRRNAETIAALGMHGSFASRFEQLHARNVDDTLKVSDATSGIGAIAKTFRFVLQSAILGLGAVLVVRGEMSGGAMLAASILTSRALAPVELAVAHLKALMAARQGYARLKEILPQFENQAPSLALPSPSRSLSVDDVTLSPPGDRRLIVMGVRFQLTAGQSLGLIGPSGSGKSSLARALVGIWQPVRGGVRLDGALMTQWDRDAIGRSVGYLPQDVELFPGTIAQNIARFDADATTDAILAGARAAGAHDMIVALPDGYETVIGEGGAALSGGQRQRIALARALYGDPFLIVLDEPNSSLDADGDTALTNAIHTVKARGGIVIVVTHRPSGLAAADFVGIMKDGRLQTFGPRDEVLPRVTGSANTRVAAVKPADGAKPARDVAEPARTRTRPLFSRQQPDQIEMADVADVTTIADAAKPPAPVKLPAATPLNLAPLAGELSRATPESAEAAKDMQGQDRTGLPADASQADVLNHIHAVMRDLDRASEAHRETRRTGTSNS
jgi:ATP-binding cassette subfamily C protein